MVRDFRIYINRSELAEILLDSGAFPELGEVGVRKDDVHFEVADSEGKHLSGGAIRDSGCKLCLMCTVNDEKR
jgi:hypothetical protein